MSEKITTQQAALGMEEAIEKASRYPLAPDARPWITGFWERGTGEDGRERADLLGDPDGESTLRLMIQTITRESGAVLDSMAEFRALISREEMPSITGAVLEAYEKLVSFGTKYCT